MISVNIPTHTYNFKIKRIPSFLKILLGKIKNVTFSFLYHISNLHRPKAIKKKQ